MGHRFDYDSNIKHTFEIDVPTMLTWITGGLAVKAFLNVELPVILKRVADLVMQLEDASLLHLEFQSTNDRDMAHRVGIMALLIGQRYPRRRLRQVVLYLGEGKVRMPKLLRVEGVTVEYELIDIRDFDAQALLATGNPGDCALALLARGGPESLRTILRQANRLPPEARERALSHLYVFSGLRRMSNQLRMEMKAMGITIDIEKNSILKDTRDSALAAGRMEGRMEGRVEGFAKLLEVRFGELPTWAQERLARATPVQIDRWTKSVFRADSLEVLLGKK
ncbi:MAG: hypothetical protein K2X03_18545 [Bryobacteraceae bacterium]|nr:hypothetical protein [Bryobacteraceae bacterium]